MTDQPFVEEIARMLVRIEANWTRETSGPGSRFEGKRLEIVQAMDFSAIVAVARLDGCHTDTGQQRCSEWAVPGSWHWELTDVRTLATPVPCVGAQRVWILPAAVETAVRAQLARNSGKAPRMAGAGQEETAAEPASGYASDGRALHLAWAKQRALEYADKGDAQNAIASLTSDLAKHPATKNHIGLELMWSLAMNGHFDRPGELRTFIEGFN